MKARACARETRACARESLEATCVCVCACACVCVFKYLHVYAGMHVSMSLSFFLSVYVLFFPPFFRARDARVRARESGGNVGVHVCLR